MQKLIFVLLWITLLVGCAEDTRNNPGPEVGLTTSPGQGDSWKLPFPAHWWRVHLVRDTDGLERLPHQTGAQEVVLSRRNEFKTLHYDYPMTFQHQGHCYASVFDVLASEKIWKEKSSQEIFDLLVELNYEKARQYPQVADLLERTGNLKLLSDSYESKNSIQHFYIGEVWTEVRKALRQGVVLSNYFLTPCQVSP